MSNKKLYNIILQNYPDLITRRRSEVNLNVEEAAEVKNEPAKLPVTITVKMPKTNDLASEKTDGKSKEKDKTVQLDGIINESKQPNKQTNIDRKAKPKVPHPSTNWLARQISTDHHYLRDMPLYRNTIMHRGAMMNIPRYKLRACSLPDIYRNSMWSLDSESDDEMVRIFLQFPFPMFIQKLENSYIC